MNYDMVKWLYDYMVICLNDFIFIWLDGSAKRNYVGQAAGMTSSQGLFYHKDCMV